MRLKLNGCSGAHTPAHAPQQPHPELGAPLSTMGLCAPSCGPLPKLAGQSAQEVGEKGVFLWGKKAAARLFSMQSISCKMPGWMKHKLESR